MRILGIDPGLANSGFGIVDVDGRQLHAIEWGVVTTPKTDTQATRLRTIERDFDELLATWAPAVVVIERMIFARAARHAQQTAEARGVIVAVVARHGIPVEGYTPQQAKCDLTGSGRADKAEVQEAVAHAFGMASIPRPDHAADALAQVVSYVRRKDFR